MADNISAVTLIFSLFSSVVILIKCVCEQSLSSYSMPLSLEQEGIPCIDYSKEGIVLVGVN